MSEDTPRAILTLAADWKAQPAASPDIPPVADHWIVARGGSWKTLSGGAKVVSTGAVVDPGEVHSIWMVQAFTVPESWQGKQVLADFRRIEGDAIVFLNGQRVAELLRPGGELNLTDYIHWGGTNELLVFMTRNYTGISRGYEQDTLRYYVRTKESIPMSRWRLGITAPVTILARPDTAITDVFVLSSWRKKALELEVGVQSEHALAGVRLEATVYDMEGKPVLQMAGQPTSLVAGASRLRLSSPWEYPVTWELDDPYLYTVKVRLVTDEQVIDVYPAIRFGFRELWTEGNQLLMNGHPSRWRLSEMYGADANGLSLYRLLGFNVAQIQPHPLLWWTDWPETPIFEEELLNAMDEAGMGCTLPAPSVAYLRESFNKPGVAEAYRSEMEYYIRQYRNHPSILAWVVGMNSYCPRENMEPEGMGRRETQPGGQGQVINAAVTIAKQADPTRLAYSHADGSTGDLSTSNLYLNFAPLQEREEWPMSWKSNADMPYCAVEFGAPFYANYWKDKQFLLTEYLAMYQGDQAYLAEGDSGLANTIAYGLLNTKGFGKWSKVDVSAYASYWDFLELFVRNTNRAWRTWGVNGGWNYWMIAERFGHPEQSIDVPNYEALNYDFLTEPLTEKPAWASPNFDIFSQANQPLLVYLAGAPIFTDKTHAYYAGESVQKQVAAVWDGSKPCDILAEWSLRQDDETLISGKASLHLEPGDIRFAPIHFTLPEDVTERTALTLELTVQHDGELVATDVFPLEVFPHLITAASPSTLALYDPARKSLPSLQKLGLQPRLWQPHEGLAGVDVLIVGREAIQAGSALPYRPEDIANGLRVIVMEQKPEVWHSIGFETVETMPRYVFLRDGENPIFEGLESEDFINWRGSPDLLPEGKPALAYDVPHAPKWTNRHAVASVVLKTPQSVGFTPLLEAEFDLAYSPLLEWRYGRGAVYFSTLDISDRLGAEPAADLIIRNLVEATAAKTLQQTRQVYFLGDAAEKQRLEALGVAPVEAIPAVNPSAALLIVSHATETDRKRLDAFAQAGGNVLFLRPTSEVLEAAGYVSREASIRRVEANFSSDLLRGIGPGLLRWRDALDLTLPMPTSDDVLADGLLLDTQVGQGRVVYLQATPCNLSDRYADEPERHEAVQLSSLRLQRLLAQVLTNLSASPSTALAKRLTTSLPPPSVTTLRTWKVLGPYQSQSSKPAQMLDETFSGEETAIQGAENPNTTHQRYDGEVLDWRRTVDANHDGFIDLGKALGGYGHGLVAYATRSLTSDRAQTVSLSMGVDYWMEVWVNGESVLKVNEDHGMPQPTTFTVDVPLVEGHNVITVKVVSGTNGFGFWCRMKSDVGFVTHESERLVSLYGNLFKPFDPYRYTYW